MLKHFFSLYLNLTYMFLAQQQLWFPEFIVVCFCLFVCFIASVDCIVQMREGGKFSQCKLREFS